jgi:hypothetical protein
MNSEARKKLKKINRIFQNRHVPIPRMNSENDDLARSAKNQEDSQPIYFDELSLSKFIEDFLDYQIQYAYEQLE